jgi:F420H(2)-dependent quinone reductase
MGIADRSWPLLRRFMRAHAHVYRATGGLVGQRFPGAPPILLLDHVGARTGTVRTSPLALE